MLRIGAIFIAVCMVLIAASLGAVLFLAVKLDGRTAAIAAVAALAAMMLYYNISNRLRDRSDLGDQIADLSRGTADLARQVAEVSRRLSAVESRASNAANGARGAEDPLAVEIGELGTLVRQIAETVAAHAAALEEQGALPHAPGGSAVDAPLALSESDAVNGVRRFRGLSREGIVELVGKAIEANRDRSLSAADRHPAAAQGAPLRGAVAAAHRGRRDRAGRRIHRLRRERRPDAQARQSAAVPLRAGHCAACT